MITFKENTFIKGDYEELEIIGEDIQDKGAQVSWKNFSTESKVLYYGKILNLWEFRNSENSNCKNELTKSQLYEAYGIVDFSILNESNVFYIETNKGKWLYQGKNPLKYCKRVTIDLIRKHIYSSDNGCLLNDKNNYKLIRLATTEEIEPYKEHFKLNNMETRPIQISQETATRWYNSEDNELKQLAIQTFPELDEATPKVGDLCLFGNDERYFNLGVGTVGIYERCRKDGFHECQSYATFFKYCKKIKTIEFY